MASVGFIGVGKLGQACAEMVAEVHDVVGYDVNPVEPENFTMVSTVEDAVRGQDIVFVAVPTPHDPQYDGKAPTSHLPNKDFDYTLVKQVLSEVNVGNIVKPIKKLFEKKKEPQFLEEQIRDQVPTDIEEEKNEKV